MNKTFTSLLSCCLATCCVLYSCGCTEEHEQPKRKQFFNTSVQEYRLQGPVKSRTTSDYGGAASTSGARVSRKPVTIKKEQFNKEGNITSVIEEYYTDNGSKLEGRVKTAYNYNDADEWTGTTITSSNNDSVLIQVVTWHKRNKSWTTAIPGDNSVMRNVATYRDGADTKRPANIIEEENATFNDDGSIRSKVIRQGTSVQRWNMDYSGDTTFVNFKIARTNQPEIKLQQIATKKDAYDNPLKVVTVIPMLSEKTVKFQEYQYTYYE